MKKNRANSPRVPRLCPGGTVVCIGGGTSITAEDIEYVRDKADAVIVINNAYEDAPWATALFAADARWWRWNCRKSIAPGRMPWEDFPGLKLTSDRYAVFPGVTVIEHTGQDGIETESWGIRTGQNSGFMAMNVAVHFGASRIVLLGYDCKRSKDGRRNYHDRHKIPSQDRYGQWLQHFKRLPAEFARLGISVVNCSPDTDLKCFSMKPLREVEWSGAREVACA